MVVEAVASNKKIKEENMKKAVKDTQKSLKTELIITIIACVVCALIMGFVIGVCVNITQGWDALTDAYNNHLVKGPN